MNIVSTMVGITIMGAAAPSVMQMTLAPVEAQARARNFSEAESAAVTFAAANEGQREALWLTNDLLKPGNCDDPVDQGSGAWDITCYGGEPDSKYRQKVTRSYRLDVDTGAKDYNWERPIPGNIGSHQCPGGDNWGFDVRGHNEIHGPHVGFCIPRVAWTEEQYLDSDPSQWVYDLREFARTRDYATHPDFE